MAQHLEALSRVGLVRFIDFAWLHVRLHPSEVFHMESASLLGVKTLWNRLVTPEDVLQWKECKHSRETAEFGRHLSTAGLCIVMDAA